MKNKKFLAISLVGFIIMILGIIYIYNISYKKTNKTWETSANSLALEASKLNSNNNETKKYEFSDGKLVEKNADFKLEGDLPNSGILLVSGSEIAYGLSDGKWCTQKSFFSEKIKTTKVSDLPNNNCGIPVLDESIIELTNEDNFYKAVLKKLDGRNVSYGIRSSDLNSETKWQTSNIFMNLENGKKYTFHLKVGEKILTGNGIDILIKEKPKTETSESEKIEIKYISTDGGKISSTSEYIIKGFSNNKITYTPNSGFKFTEFKIKEGSCAGEFNNQTGVCTKINVPIIIQVVFSKLISNTTSKIQVYYEANGGFCDKTMNEIENGTKSLPPKCTRDGHKISGYYRLEGKTGKFDAKTGIVTEFTDTQKIKVNWEKISEKYKVIYEANGGTCESWYVYVEAGGKALSPKCTKDGHKLINYTRISGTTGNLEQTTGTVTNISDNQTIKLNWEKIANTYKVIYDANGGICDPSYVYIEEGKTTSAPNCTKEGKTISSFTRVSGSTGDFNPSTGIITEVRDNQTILINWE